MEPGILSVQEKQTLDQFAVFEVEGKVFRERRDSFEKWSKSPFTEMFSILEDNTNVGSEENPIRLSVCTAAQFKSLLDVIHAPDDQVVPLDKAQWISVLRLARRWDMPQLATRAVDVLDPDLSPMEKISLGRASAHRVVQWIREGFTDVIQDLNEMTPEGLAEILGWEAAARVLWALRKASLKSQPSLANLSLSSVVNEIVGEEFGEEELAGTQAADSTHPETIPSPPTTVSSPDGSSVTGRSTGFPTGYFRIRVAGTQHYWTPRWYETHQDGNSIALWTLNDGTEEQVCFVNAHGNLCCGSHGAHVDVIGNGVIIAHNRPVSTLPGPNPWSHPLPTFSYSEETKMITVKSYAEPSVSAHSARPESEWKNKEFVLAAPSVTAVQTPSFDEIARWAPSSKRAKNRWTIRAGARCEANTWYNLGVEEKTKEMGLQDLNRMKWELDIV